MNQTSKKIIINLKDNHQKENLFFLMVLLANLHIGHIRHNLTGSEHQIFCFHIKDVYKKIYHHDSNWTEAYSELSKHLTMTDDIDGNVFNAIRFGLGDVSQQEAQNISMLFEFSYLFLESMISRGNRDLSYECKEMYKQIMIDLGIL